MEETKIRPELLKEPAKELNVFSPFLNTNATVNNSNPGETEIIIPSAIKETLIVTPSMITVKSGESVQFTVTKQNAFGNTILVTPVWTITEGKEKGYIDVNGKFRATRAGTVVVKAEYEDISNSVTIVITPDFIKEMIITPKDVTITLKQTQQFTVIAKDSYNNEISIFPVWSIEDNKIGKIDEKGLFTPLKSGKIKIYAAYGSIKDYAVITVSEADI